LKIYLAARYSRRDELRAIASDLRRLGHTITSRWLDTTWEGKDATGSSAAPPEYREKHAVEDLEDVLAAELFIAFTEEPRSGGRGGRHIEFGAALAVGKRLIVVGHRENLFYHHPRVVYFPTVEEMMSLGFGIAEGVPR
jgi:hypothetical protein